MQAEGGPAEPAFGGCWQGVWRWFPFTCLLCVPWVCTISITACPGVIYPRWELGSAPPGSPRRADTTSSFQSLCQSPNPGKELGSGRTMVPIQRCLELDPSRDGPISCSQHWFPLSLVATGTDQG